MSNLLHRMFPFLAQRAESRELRAEVLATFPEDWDPALRHIIKDSVDRSAKGHDIDALRIYRDLDIAKHHLLEFAIDAVREALGVHDVHGIMTEEHVTAYDAVYEAYSDAIQTTNTHVRDYPDGNIQRIAAIALRDLETSQEIADLIRERCLLSLDELKEVLAVRNAGHSSLAEGAL